MCARGMSLEAQKEEQKIALGRWSSGFPGANRALRQNLIKLENVTQLDKFIYSRFLSPYVDPPCLKEHSKEEETNEDNKTLLPKANELRFSWFST